MKSLLQEWFSKTVPSHKIVFYQSLLQYSKTTAKTSKEPGANQTGATCSQIINASLIIKQMRIGLETVLKSLFVQKTCYDVRSMTNGFMRRRLIGLD